MLAHIKQNSKISAGRHKTNFKTEAEVIYFDNR